MPQSVDAPFAFGLTAKTASAAKRKSRPLLR